MTSPAPLLAIVLLAFLVGAAIPVLYQLYHTLKRARALLDTMGPRLESALDQVGQAADRINGIGSTLEGQVLTLRPLFEAATRLRHSIDRSGEWLGTAMAAGGAVGPAVIAGVRAFFSGTGVERDPRATREAAARAVKHDEAAFEQGRDEMRSSAGHPSRRIP